MAEIETQGTGEVERLADRAGLHVSFTAHARDRTGAVNALTNLIGKVEPALDRSGVQVRQRQLYVHDVWDGKRRSGAQATQTYILRITDLTALDDLVADLVVTEPASLNGPFWELADQEEATHQAQRDAVANARHRAEGYAEALNARLGALLRLSDGPAGSRPMRFATMAAVRGPEAARRPDIGELSLEPQLVTVTASCTMTWEIEG